MVTERFSTLEPLVQQYALDALGYTEKVYSGPYPLPSAVAISTREIDVRMLVQQAAFTVHADGAPLANKGDKIMSRYSIPATNKKSLRERLACLGLRVATVFPDLQHLADELRDAEFHAAPV